MGTKYYTVTLTEKQKDMVLKALTSHYFNVEDDLRSVRVLEAVHDKIKEEWLRQNGYSVDNEEEKTDE
tara:strand:+ start:438 stop:641 length:204 start_codon:yes stop_codon:yes gene_type:complete